MDTRLLFSCLFQFFSAKPRDWLGRTSPKWPILCLVGRKTLTQSISQRNSVANVFCVIIARSRFNFRLVDASPAWCCSVADEHLQFKQRRRDERRRRTKSQETSQGEEAWQRQGEHLGLHRMVPWTRMSRSPKRHLDRFSHFCTAHCMVRRHLTWCLCLLPLLTCLTGEDCYLHRLISLTFRPSAYQLSAVVPFRLLVIRSGTSYQMMSPLLHPCEHCGAIWRHTYSAAVTTLSDTVVLTLTIVVLVVALLLRPL